MGFRKTASILALVVSTAVVGAFAAPAGAAEGPRGTGTATIGGASIGVGDLASVDLIDLSSTATRDAERAGVANDVARGSLSLAGVALTDLAETSVPPEPLAVERSSENPGKDEEASGAQTVNVPGDVSAASVGADRGSVIDFVNGLAGIDASAIADGDVLTGTVEPIDLLALFNDSEASFNGGTRIADASALGGLVALDGFGVAEQESWSRVDQAGAAIRGASLDSVTVLDLEAFLGLLGLSLEDIPLSTLVALVDQLGEELTGTVGDLDLAEFDSWDGLFDELDGTSDDLQETVDAGGTCETLTEPIGDLLDDTVTCDDIEGALDEVNGLLDDLRDAVEGVLAGAALLSVEDLKGEVQAAAAVDSEGIATTSASATGSVGAVKVGGVTVGSIEADFSQAPLSSLQAQWDSLQSDVHGALDGVLGLLGDEYAGLVTVQAVPSLVRNTGIDGQYATAEAQLSLLRVVVELPGALPDPVDLAAEETADDGSSTDTTSTTTTTTTLLDTGDLLEISNVRPAPVLAQQVTIDVGTLSASAEHTRDIEITGGGENLALPRTGGTANTFVLLFAGVIISAGWYGRRLLAQTAARGV